MIGSITATWAGVKISGAQWLQMISTAFSPVLGSPEGVAGAAALLSSIGSLVLPTSWYNGIAAALNTAATVLGAIPAIIGLLAIFVQTARAMDTPAGWNPIGSAVGAPTIAATGAIASYGGNGGLCADAYGPTGAPISQVVAVNTCDGSADQEWTVWSDSTVTNGGMCMGIGAPARWAGGWPLQLTACSSSAYQKWTQQYTAFEPPRCTTSTPGCVPPIRPGTPLPAP